MARLTSTRLQSDLRQHSTVIVKVHLPFSNQPSHFLPQPTFWLAFFHLTFNLKTECPSQVMTILSPQQMTMPMSTVCHGQLIYGFIQTQQLILRSVYIYELYSTHCSHNGSLCLCKIPILLSFRPNASLPCRITGLV